MRRWFFRLKNGQWGYVYAASKSGAVKAAKRDHGSTPVHVERA